MMVSLLKDAREKKGMTQSEVADRVKMKLQQYQRYENGERSLMSTSFRIATDVCKVLDIELKSMIQEAEKK